MNALLVHRGPDERGHLLDGPCALAACRLAVQDVAGGHQPARSEDGTVAAVLNGEIYNFRSLRSELAARGHRFASGSDTEVLPHLYEECGIDFLERLRGMFTIAVWDATSQRLVVARDRLGKKPLYWTEHRGSIRFASEIKALFADPTLPRRADLAAIHLYLGLQYVPAPATAFEGIAALPPAHRLIVDRSGVRTERWWRLRRPPNPRLSVDEAAAATRQAVGEAVAVRLGADVPVGAFLSGGVDSACVVAAMAERSSGPVRTFTVGFDERSRDEREAARITARALGTEHHELKVDADAIALLPLLAWHFDQPFGDHAALPTYLMARETRRHVTVVLTGDGGDEAFAGYERIQRLARPAWSRPVEAVWRIIDRLPEPRDPGHLVAIARRAGRQRFAPPASAYAVASGLFPDRYLLGVYTPGMRAAVAGASAAEWLEGAIAPDGADPVWRGQAADYSTYLPGALLPKLDVATMAVALEARSPLLDQEVVRLAASLPTAYKVGRGQSKVVLRRAFRGEVPDAVLDGPKRGFGLPLDAWFRGRLAPVGRRLLLGADAHVTDLILPEHLRLLLDRHEHGSARHGARLFALVALELWFRLFIAQPPSPTPPAETTLADLAM